MARPRGGLLLLLLLVCHAVALLLFCKGFLLRRVVIPEYSNCSLGHPAPSERDWSRQRTQIESQSCYPHPRRFQRVVWLLIDALRYDFLEYDPSLDPSPPVFRNKLPFVRALLESRPQNARLFRFVADPPTTTMQRLKALTTGSLPTFIDIGSNFNSHRISEDSLPFQAHANGRNLTFIGDDTWLGLYEEMLTKVFAYPSLNVKDLHTVDDGVIRHMVPELERQEAEFVVGHFLGVDHVGHTYGSTHWTMGEKLAQMNKVLQSIFSAVGEDTVVFVFGDHGMTVSGDHGGETEMETTAGLLVYTPSPLFPPEQNSGRTVYQIDIVPTVALLLGVPIPFSNLGMLIPEVLLPWERGHTAPGDTGSGDGYSGRVTLDFINLLRANAEQMQTYLKTYVKQSEDFPSDVYVNLQNKLSAAQKLHEEIRANPDPSQEQLTATAGGYVGYMREVKAMCHNVWAKFDDVHIVQGTALLSLAVLLTLLALFDPAFSLASLGRSVRLAFPLGVLVSLVCLVVSPLPLEVGVTGVVDVALSLSFYPLLLYVVVHSLTLCHHMYTLLKERSIFEQISSLLSRISFTYAFGTMVAVSCSVSLMSNSFILYEGDMTVFFLQSMLICFLIQRAQSLSKGCAPVISGASSHSEKKSSWENWDFSLKSVLRESWPLLLAMVLVRLSKAFHACRDMQVGCESTSFVLPYHGVVEVWGYLAGVRLAFSCLGVASVPLALAGWVRLSGLSGELGRLQLVCVYLGLPLASLCMCGFWLVQSLPQPTLDSLPHWQHVLLPRVVYGISLSTIVISVIAPFRKSHSASMSNGDSGSKEPSHVVLGRGGGNSNSEISTVRRRVTATASMPYAGMERVGESEVATVGCESAPARLVMAAVLVAVWLPVAMVLNDGVALSAVLLALQVSLTVSGLPQSQERSSWPVVVLWGLVSSQFFFGFGHHATVTSLRFDAGFVGLRGEMSGLPLLFAGLLVGLNMLGSHLLLGLGLLPLLPLSLSVKPAKEPPSNSLLLTTALQYILFHSFKTLVTLLTASLQRRHLMVWGVFSPRFLYEAAFLGATHISVIISFLLTSSLLLTPSPSSPIRTRHPS